MTWSASHAKEGRVGHQGLSVIDAGRSFDGLPSIRPSTMEGLLRTGPSIRCLWRLLGANGEITVDGEYAAGRIEPSW